VSEGLQRVPRFPLSKRRFIRHDDSKLDIIKLPQAFPVGAYPIPRYNVTLSALLTMPAMIRWKRIADVPELFKPKPFCPESELSSAEGTPAPKFDYAITETNLE
jgi:hypothetical protein